MGTTPKWERGSHLEISTDEKLDYLYSRDDAQQDEINANIVKVTPATYPEGTETYNIATIKVGNTTKTLKGKEGGGGAADFEVNTTNAPNEGTWTCNKTYSEIKAAYTAGSRVLFNIPYTFDEEGQDVRTQTLQMAGYQEGGEGGYGAFAVGSDPDDFSTVRIYVFYANTTSDYPVWAV